MLIVGTGERAEDVLSGLDFLGIACSKVNAPNEHPYQDHYDKNLVKMYMAELKDVNNQYNTNLDILGLIASQGDGAVELVPYSLSKLVLQDVESYVYELLVPVNSYTKIVYDSKDNYYNNNSTHLLRALLYRQSAFRPPPPNTEYVPVLCPSKYWYYNYQ